MSQVSSTKRLVSASAIMAAGTLVSRVLGVLRVMLITFILGTATRQSDIFAIATMVPNSLYVLFVGGALNTVLVPQIVRHINSDDDGGEAYTNRIMTAFMLIVTFVAVVVTIAAPAVTWIYSSSSWRAPELAGQYSSMVTLTYLTLPQIFFYGAFFLLGQILNARDKFGPMMWAPIANNVISIATLSVYFLVWGNQADHSQAFTTPQLLVLGLGSTVGIAFQALVLLFYVRKIGFKLRPRFDLKGTGLGHTFSLTKWTLGFVAVNQLALVVVQKLATSATATGHGAGANVYSNAHLIWILPHSLVTISLATAMLPSASRLAADGKFDDVAREMTKTIRMALVAIVPATVAFIALAGPATSLLFGHGAGADDAVLIAWTLMGFTVGLIPFTVQFVCLRTFYALEDTRTPFFLQCFIAGINALGAILLVWLISDPSLVAAVLALAYSLAYALGVFVSWRTLKRRLPGLDGAVIVMHTVRLLLGAGVGGAAAYFLSKPILSWIPHTVWGNLVAVVVGGVLILGVYWLVGRLLKVTELKDIASLVGGRFGRRRPAASSSAPSPTEEEKVAERISEISTTQDALGSGASSSAVLVEDLMPTAVEPALTDDELYRRDSERHAADAAASSYDDWEGEPTELHDAIVDDALDEITEDDLRPPAPSVSPLIPPPQPRSDEGVLDDIFRPAGARIAEDGTVVQARYQLTELLTEREGTETWRAHDQVLSRDVVVHLLRKDDPRTDDLLSAARRGAIATESRFLRILDAGLLHDPELEVGGYVVCEYGPGKSLEKLLIAGPLSSIEAAWIVREVADALAGVHAQGQFHERITPDTVVITTSGTVRVVGFGIESSLVSPSNDERSWSERERSDVGALGALLYAMTVHRWPGAPAWGLAAAPIVDGRLARPSELRDGISAVLEQICLAAMNGQGIHTARELSNALSDMLGTADASADLEQRVRRPLRPTTPVSEPAVQLAATAAPPTLVQAPPVSAPKESPAKPTHSSSSPVEDDVSELRAPLPSRQRAVVAGISIAAVLVLVIALLIVKGLLSGDNATPVSTSPGASNSASADPGAGNKAGPLAIAGAKDFDPEADGGNDEENPDQAANAIDGKPDTAWSTLRYLRQSKLGGLKPGVGLVLDLGEEREVTSVDLTLTGEGPTGIELRTPTGNEMSMTTVDQWAMVASNTATPQGTTAFELAEPATTRYVLVYLTDLPPVEGGFRGVVNEVVVNGK